MSNESISQPRRSRGRPKKNVNYASLAGFTNLNRPSNLAPKRKQVDDSDEIEILSTNGIESIQTKKSKVVADNQPKRFDDNQPKRFDDNQPKRFEDNQPKHFDGNQPKRFDDPPKRSLPPRAARFRESYGGSPDVVVVSDEEGEEESESESDSDCSPIPSPICKVKTKEELEIWENNVQTLKKTLNDEEMKLVLLLKLKDSQKAKEPKTEARGSPLPSAALPAINNQKTLQIISRNNVPQQQQQQQHLPNKQLLANRFIPVKKEMKPNPISLTNNGPQRRPSPAPVLVKTEPSSSSASVTQSSQLKSNTLNQYPLLKNLSNQITVTPVPSTPSPSPVINKPPEVKIDAETILQRQAAAKLNLRKQLEHTLLQIPLPKPPPLKINFFPNANSVEFLCLLGLDCVVDYLTKAKKDPPREKPLCCAQCSTDFTCAWKWKEIDKNGEKSFRVFCEACINSNIRKALKAQHTNNLKSAFLKALQEEKEIDRLSQTIPKSHSSTREPRQNSCLPVPAPAHQAHIAPVYSHPKSGTTLTYIPPKPSSALNHTNLGQVGKLNPQFQSLLQAQAQHLLASGVPLNPNVLSLRSFVPPSTHHNQGKSSTGQHDFRRQYRPGRTQSPSIHPTSSGWKA